MAAGACYFFDGPADLAPVKNLRPEDQYADCWCGVLLRQPDPAPHDALDGDHGCHAGDFCLFGDVELLERVRRHVAMIHFGPYRGDAIARGRKNGQPGTPAHCR
jgi:hypothetical protein